MSATIVSHRFVEGAETMIVTCKGIVETFLSYGFILCVGVCQVGCTGQESLSISNLVTQLNASDDLTRVKACSELQKLGANAKPAIPTLVKLLEDKNSDIRSAAAETLGAIGSDASIAIPALISRLNDDKDRYVRIACIEALTSIGVKERRTLAAIKTTVFDSDTQVRICAARSMGELDPDCQIAITSLIDLLESNDDGVRFSAAYALGYIKSTRIKEAIPALVAALEDSTENVRESAAQSLGYICEESETVVPPLIDRVRKEKSTIARILAIQALGEFGPEAKAAVPVLTRASEDADHRVRATAAQALHNIKTWGKKRGRKVKQEEYGKEGKRKGVGD